jgi:hypothetical protein
MSQLKIIGIATILILAPMMAVGQEAFPFREETRLSQSSGEAGYTKLTLKEPQLRRGELASVDYTFYNTNGSYWVYNWGFNRLVPLPGQLAIFDSNRKYLGDLIRFEGGSQKAVGDSDWLFLYDGSHVGTQIAFRAGYLPMTKYGSMNTLLPNGHYFIQLILYKAFLSDNPSRIQGDNKPDFYKTFDRSEAIRSNVVAIEIVG